MAYARSQVASNDEADLDTPLETSRDVPLRDVNSRGRRMTAAELREIETLRAVNGRLLRELAAMKAREAEAQKLAERDGLTGLYNRRRMLELLEAAISDAVLQDLHVGLLFIDLNGFKAINDKYGHAAGDKILTTVATRISARVRTGDICCRYGGDEFVVVLPGVPDPFPVSRVADAIRERVSLPYWIGNYQQQLTASIGESMYPYHGENAALLVHRADEAMYRLKSRIVRPQANAVPSLPAQRLNRRRNDKTKPDKTKPRYGGTP
ncbi:MAG TPA: GGDEF domain-containing protein [Steroidobacteraceae bacterium]|jgi:diguanylate cyclase (GGDEF)-like protein|nr:GGDEF domain-containing protein [Steroidobacteraceae bacterium]